MLNPLCARNKARTGTFLKDKLTSDRGLFSFYEGQQGAANGQIRGAFFRDAQGLDGWMLARAPALPAQGLHHHEPRYFNFPYFYMTCGLEKLGLVDQN